MINDRLVLVGVATLSAVATAGWLRQTPAAVMPQATNFSAPMSLAAEPLPIQPELAAKSAALSSLTKACTARSIRHDASRMNGPGSRTAAYFSVSMTTAANT